MQLVSQLINQFFHDYPYLPTIFILGGHFVWMRFVGDWPRLVASYGNRELFIGQKWNFQSLSINLVQYSSCVTIGINSTGLYISPFVLFRGGHPPILIPWTELQIEEQRLFVGTVYTFRTNARPKIQIKITSDLLEKLEQAAQGHLPLAYSAEMKERQAVQAQARLSGPSSVFDKPRTDFKIQGKLVAKIFAVTFAVGLFFGGINHGIAHYQAWQNPDRYHIYFPSQYSSPDPSNDWPHKPECLGLSAPVYVQVEHRPDGLLVEKYHTILGSTTEVSYRGSQWLSTGGGSVLSGPLYLFNCLVPLVGSFFVLFVFLGIFGSRQMPDKGSRSEKRLNQIQIILCHSFISGLISFGTYWVSWMVSALLKAAA
jgi:hypothetical protein